MPMAQVLHGMRFPSGSGDSDVLCCLSLGFQSIPGGSGSKLLSAGNGTYHNKWHRVATFEGPTPDSDF